MTSYSLFVWKVRIWRLFPRQASFAIIHRMYVIERKDVGKFLRGLCADDCRIFKMFWGMLTQLVAGKCPQIGAFSPCDSCGIGCSIYKTHEKKSTTGYYRRNRMSSYYFMKCWSLYFAHSLYVVCFFLYQYFASNFTVKRGQNSHWWPVPDIFHKQNPWFY